MKNIIITLFMSAFLLLSGCQYSSIIGDPIIRKKPNQFELIDLHGSKSWLIKANANNNKVTVVFPAYGTNKSHFLYLSELYTSMKYDVILSDYRGFGDSNGVATKKSVFEDAENILEFAKSRYKKVYGHGLSLGSMVLTRVAAEINLSGVILEGIGHRKDIAPIALGLTTFDFNTEYWITKVDEPKLFIHSKEDIVTRYRYFEQIYDKASSKTMYLFRGAHIEAYQVDPSMYKKAIISFMRKTAPVE